MALRSRMKRRTKILVWLAVVASCLLIYANQIEPYQIEVTHFRITAPIKRPLKIAHLSDLHSSGIGRRERKMLAILDQEQPDLISITGDMISSGKDYDGCRELLKQLHAPLGVIAVPGNHENWFPPPDGRAYFESLGIVYLVDQNKQLTDDLWVLGLDDLMTRHPNFAKAEQGVPDGVYKIAMFHSPALFDSLAGHCDLVFAGHSHGGQVRVPFINPFWLPGGCGNYLEGWYERMGSKMYVSRGVGNSILDLRFNCRPEISFVTVGP